MSNRRRMSPLAEHDGTEMALDACCHLEVFVRHDAVDVRHDAGCPALDPADPGFLTARMQASAAITRALRLA